VETAATGVVADVATVEVQPTQPVELEV
jgi:hypothetical protein